jgi:hypothetical protein
MIHGQKNIKLLDSDLHTVKHLESDFCCHKKWGNSVETAHFMY